MEKLWQELLQKKNKWLILLLIGVLLIILAMPTSNGEKDSNEKYALDEEMRLKSVLEEMEAVGKVKVMISYQDSRTVEGVAVIAEGADNVFVMKNIRDVVQALFDVDSHKIKVMKGN